MTNNPIVVVTVEELTKLYKELRQEIFFVNKQIVHYTN